MFFATAKNVWLEHWFAGFPTDGASVSLFRWLGILPKMSGGFREKDGRGERVVFLACACCKFVVPTERGSLGRKKIIFFPLPSGVILSRTLGESLKNPPFNNIRF
ncbi:hypothetical protein CDAR_419001 [Caerostris darwini]|uniref:Uncharacterized protein n=1 Tax=Caerostris darwini TaxID=1538125 RepID=A0AAV4MXB8_9ARAC|nr:hypothetical protein CDAR_419001 [Caerostris darwini]